jgi:hypothetical protein
MKLLGPNNLLETRRDMKGSCAKQLVFLIRRNEEAEALSFQVPH